MSDAIPITPRFFQLAYVTRDLTRARADIGRSMGLVDFAAGSAAAAIDLRIPRGEKASLEVAIAWSEAWQVELIRPVSGAIGIYEAGLPEGEGVAFHHIGAHVAGTREDWERFRATVADQTVVLEGGRTQMRFIYVDQRATLGHYVEYVWMSDAFIDANPAWRPLRTLAGGAA